MLRLRTTAILFLLALLLAPTAARAHCDTLDGPVVSAAKLALNSGDIAPVLKWISKADEPAIRAAFQRAVQVRAQSPPARELADSYFFETLVRVHRASEGVAYTGLKPAGTVEPFIARADKALQQGSAEELLRGLQAEMLAAARTRFERAHQLAAKKDESAEAGRRYVAAYVEFMHFLEALHRTWGEAGDHHAAPVEHAHQAPPAQHEHEH